MQVRIGDVLIRTWRVLSRHFVTFLLLVGVADLIPLPLGLYRQERFLGVLSSLLAIVLSSFAHAIVVFAAFQDLRGCPVSGLESLRQGTVRLVPVVATVLLFVAAFIAGTLLCVAPGLLALALLAVAVPACVVERSGPIASLKRSAALTKGLRWPILGVSVAWFTIYFAGDSILRGTVGGESVAAELAGWAWGVVLGSYSSVYSAILYHDLRAAKEGIGIAEIAAVFD